MVPSSSYIPIHQLTPACVGYETPPSGVVSGKGNSGRSVEHLTFGYGKKTELNIGILDSDPVLSLTIVMLADLFIFTYLLYNTFNHYFWVYSLYLKKKLAVTQCAVLPGRQPHPSCVYHIPWLHHFLLCWISFVLHSNISTGLWPKSNSLYSGGQLGVPSIIGSC